MRILITGGCGFLGSHIVEHLLKNTAHNIVILDKLSYASAGYDRLRDIRTNSGINDATTHPRVKIIGCDLTQPVPDGVGQEVGDVDYIIHAAAETHVDNSIVDPMPFLKSNVIGTHHLLWWARGLKNLKRIFLVSTDEVYGPAQFGEDVAGFDEEATYRPANPYAAAKAGSEMVAFAYANTYKLPITIVNTMNLVGERQHHEKFVPMVIRRALLGEKVLIHADPTKTFSGTRFYLHCRTYADALGFLIRRDGEAFAPGDLGTLSLPNSTLPLKLHVCGEREISNLDLAQMLAGFVGKPLHYELVDFHSSRPGHDLRYAMQDRRIRDLGWKRPMGIEQSLEKTVKWYLANPKWLGL
jgi:dTDP-glucose 4,6-dehydratase